MNPSMKIKKPVTTLEPEVKKHVDAIISWLIKDEKQSYDNTLVPFAIKEAEIRTQTEEECVQLQNKLQRAVQILKNNFALQESEKLELPENSSFAHFEAAFGAFKERLKEPNCDIVTLLFTTPIQEEMGLSWPFMDRCYRVGKSLLESKSYEEAEAVFTFLRILHQEVFEYWFGQAIAQQASHKFDEAIASYTKSLFLQPSNPLPFFQLASCYQGLGDVASCIKALEFCIDLAKENPNQTALQVEAEETKQALQQKKAA